MKIVFEDNALKELYEYGKTNDRRYIKYNKDKCFVKKLVLQINSIRAAQTYEDLYRISPLHYEKLKHMDSLTTSFRIGNKFVERVICKECIDCIELIFIKLDDTHYGNKK